MRSLPHTAALLHEAQLSFPQLASLGFFPLLLDPGPGSMSSFDQCRFCVYVAFCIVLKMLSDWRIASQPAGQPGIRIATTLAYMFISFRLALYLASGTSFYLLFEFSAVRFCCCRLSSSRSSLDVLPSPFRSLGAFMPCVQYLSSRFFHYTRHFGFGVS